MSEDKLYRGFAEKMGIKLVTNSDGTVSAVEKVAHVEPAPSGTPLENITIDAFFDEIEKIGGKK